MTRQQMARKLNKVANPYGINVRLARGGGYLISSPQNYKAFKVRDALAAFVNDSLSNQVATWQGYIDGLFPHVDGESGVSVLREVMSEVVPVLKAMEVTAWKR